MATREEWDDWLDSKAPPRLSAIYRRLEAAVGPLVGEWSGGSGSDDGHFMLCIDTPVHHLEIETEDGADWEWFYRDRDTGAGALAGEEGLAWGATLSPGLIRCASLFAAQHGVTIPAATGSP